LATTYDISTFCVRHRVFWRFVFASREISFRKPAWNPVTGILVELGGVFRLAEVKLQEGETLENALRRFKRKVQQEDIIKEVKRHSFYLKPGEKRRAKQALARKRNRKKSRREIE